MNRHFNNSLKALNSPSPLSPRGMLLARKQQLTIKILYPMKNLSIIMLLLLINFKGIAQNDVNVNIVIPPPFTPFLSDYTTFGGQNLITLTNTTANTLQLKLMGSITGEDNGLFLFTKPEYMPAAPIVLGPFQTYTVTASTPSKNFLTDANTESNVNQQQRDAILASGVLPEGTYKVCVRAVDYFTNQPYSAEDPLGCTYIFISFPLPPILLNPVCHSEVQNPFPSFNWTPVISSGSFFLYDLYILKLLPTQIPEDAMWLAISANVGNPIKIPNNVAPVYQYKPYDLPLQPGETYAWCVVARDAANQIVVANQGRSEVCTFTYTTTPIFTPPVTENTPGGGVLPEFNLNNTSISGKILYRFKANENFGDPGQPTYNPSVTVFDEPRNILELNAMQASASGNNTNNAAATNTNFGEQELPSNTTVYTQGFQHLGGQTGNAQTAFQGSIKIDPNKKYLYENTLSLASADPLRQTSVSLYLEYVALKRVENGDVTFFQVVPAVDAVYNKTGINKHSGFMDPQLISSGNNQVINRSTGSELLATAITDNDGNFTFNFDMTENTGLLSKGPATLKYHRFTEPEIIDQQIWVHPLDMISNPLQNITNPAQDVVNQFNDVVNGQANHNFGNTQLQGNQGWGNQILQGGAIQNQNLNNQNINGPNFNKKLNKGMGGPSGEYIYFPDEDNWIEWEDYTVHNLFKVLRIRVNDPYYCHPDILIFAQPGEQMAIPPVATFVNSFNLELKVLAGGKVADDPFLAPDVPISGFNVRLGRIKSFWDNKAHNFPLHEGMDIQPEQSFYINNNTPYFIGWNDNKDKPGQLKFSSQDVTSSSGKVTFKNLVRNKQNVNNDAHYFEVVYPLTSIYNYQGAWGSYKLFTNFYHSDYAGVVSIPHSYNFKPILHKEDVKLEPLNPELLLRTVVRSNIETSPLSGVQVYMQEYKKTGSTFSYINYRSANTDVNGYQRFTNLSMQHNSAGGLNNPYRRIYLYKNGYKVQYKPVDVANHNNITSNFYQPVKKGQRLDLNEIEMVGGANVHGYVKDEFNNPVTALIKIGDGPYHMTTNMFGGGAGYDNPVYSNGQDPPGSTQLNNNDLFNLINNGALLGMIGNDNNQNLILNKGFNFVTQGNVGNFEQTNTTVNAQLATYSRFQINAAATGNNTRVIVIPMSDQYFADTFYVNIPQSNQSVNIGTFKVFERAHRVSIKVNRAQAGVLQGSPNAIVEVGEVVGVTNSQGICNLRFTTPDSYFRIFIKDGNRVPIEEYRHIPISKNYRVLEYTTQPGKTVYGTVIDAVTQQPISGARIYAQTGITEYGQTIVQAISDPNGNYVLNAIPMNCWTIQAVKSGSAPTYIGKTLALPPPSQGVPVSVVNIALQPLADVNVAKLYGFEVELNDVQKNGEEYTCSGAFIRIPESGNFKVYNPDVRVRFNNIKFKKSNSNDPNGIAIAEAIDDEAKTMELILRMRLFDSFISDMQSDRNEGLASVITVVKEPNRQGAFRGRILTDLESFRFSFNYSGKFYISSNTDNLTMKPLQSNYNSNVILTSYYVMDKGIGNNAKDIQFKIHNFNAKADRSESKIDNQKVRLATKLYPQLQLAGQIEVDAGFINVTPTTIQINNPGHQIAFNLEQWEIKSTNGWSYSIPYGGIVIPKAKITTQMVDIPVNNLILRPNQLIMPGDNIDLSNLTLGGGVTKLNQYPNTTALMNFDPACSYDLGPHWRFTIYRNPGTLPACYLQGLPGFVSSDRIDIGSFTIYSNNSTLIQPINQTKKYYNIVDLNIQNIINTKDAVEIAGAMMTGIPGVTPPTVIMEYTKSGNNIIRKTKAMDLVLETPGKIFFNGGVGNDFYVLQENYFEANGALAFENDDMHDGKLILLKGKVIKTPTSTTLTIPKLLENNTNQAFQYIPLDGGSGKLKVLNGEQKVVGNQWNTMKYTADLITPNPTDGLNNRTLDYLVSGAVEVDASSGNSVKIDKIETPLGGMTMVFDWEKGSFLGTLTFNIPIQMGAIELSSGMFECMFSGQGFYFDMMGKVAIPGLSEVLSVNVGFLTGYYPKLPNQVIKRHEEIMFLLGVPEYIKVDGIKGVYINANAAPDIANWSISVPVPLFSVGFGVNAGVDFSFLLNFGNTTSVMAIDAAAYAKAWAGVQVLACTFCVGAMADFMVNGTLQFAPKVEASFNACASFTVFGEFCGVEASKTIGCRAKAASNSGLDLSVQWSACGGQANKKDASCDF